MHLRKICGRSSLAVQRTRLFLHEFEADGAFMIAHYSAFPPPIVALSACHLHQII